MMRDGLISTCGSTGTVRPTLAGARAGAMPQDDPDHRVLTERKNRWFSIIFESRATILRRMPIKIPKEWVIADTSSRFNPHREACRYDNDYFVLRIFHLTRVIWSF